MSVRTKGKFSRFLAYLGPGYLISVGYMDPGNWATDLAGGSRFGYSLLWVVLLSSLMAIVLQTLCARLGIALGKDLAQACRDTYSRPVNIALWLGCEVAIIACDIAEVIGSAIALYLLFGLPLTFGVLITGLDVLALMAITKFGFRKLEAIVILMVITIFGAFAVNLFWACPDWPSVAHGLVVPSLPNREALLVSVGILGATVMPHNLYLHSAIVMTRDYDRGDRGKASAVRWATLDTVLSLGCAFFVNAGILVLAAAVFHHGKPVEELQQAHEMLRPTLGAAAASLFAVALLSSGQSSTITATLAGQVVMEGFVKLKVRPWVRRMITRGCALIPAVLMVSGAGASHTNDLIVWTQIILSLQLPFAIFPLIGIGANRAKMGALTSPPWLTWLAYGIGGTITLLNIVFMYQQFGASVAIGVTSAGLSFAAWAWKTRPQNTSTAR